ncbi:MAG: sulfatase-like hydrolase/transferase, partial [Victivallales bacterium]|nr:sulfatase-like hydrolase/transferase [Victivallales bacterium]
SGQNQWHTGVLGMGWGQGPTPNDFSHTIPGELSKAGYRTHMVGKGHFSPQRASMGFQSTELDESGRMPDSDHRKWFAENATAGITPDDHGVDWNSWIARPWHTDEHLHPTHWTMSRALDFLKTRDESQPFFLNISFARPHSPYVPPKIYWDMYEGKDLPEPKVGEWASINDDPATAVDPNAWRGKMSKRAVEMARTGYLGEISFIDSQIGRLDNWLRRNQPEAYANTWFVFTADHGDMQGDHNLWRKTYAYEGSARIPFLIVPPGGSGGSKEKVAEQVVELRDLMPTILEAAGVEIPNDVDGKSLIPVINGENPKWREYIHGEHCQCYSHEQEMQYVTNGKRKFIWFPRLGAEQFFDLEQDPGELVDLSGSVERAAEIAEWRGFLVDELEVRDCGWVVDGKLHCPLDSPLVSPYKDNRWKGSR